ncbi:MAG: MarR family winged helix-turn-helix transcriptional regulator [Asticcacaulis sp.]
MALASAIDRACAARLSPHKLSEGKFVLLFLLRGQAEGLSPHQLAGRAGVTRATITGLLDGLERDGFLGRHSDKPDRRAVTVRLTPKGQALADALLLEHTHWIGSLFAGFTPEAREDLSMLLRRVWQNMDASPLGGAPPKDTHPTGDPHVPLFD